MPDYDDTPWNDSNTQPYDNCYDYATDNRTDHPEPLPPPDSNRDFGVPGRTKGLYPIIRVIAVDGAEPFFVFTCDGVKNGALLDGLRELKPDGSCPEDCWKVAYYIQPPRVRPLQIGDFHFARQDSDGNWSHKRGGRPVERLRDPNPSDARPLPEKADVGRGYTFCGYLCCCPNTRVAALPPRPPLSPGLALVTRYADATGLPPQCLVLTRGARVEKAVLKFIKESKEKWRNGAGTGTPIYGVALGQARRKRGEKVILLADSSVTVWDQSVRHIADPDGKVAKQFAKWWTHQKA